MAREIVRALARQVVGVFLWELPGVHMKTIKKNAELWRLSQLKKCWVRKQCTLTRWHLEPLNSEFQSTQKVHFAKPNESLCFVQVLRRKATQILLFPFPCLFLQTENQRIDFMIVVINRRHCEEDFNVMW